MLRSRNKIKIIWFYSENVTATSKDTAEFKAFKKHLRMFFDVKREELRYLFCIGETRKKNNVRPILILTIFATAKD